MKKLTWVMLALSAMMMSSCVVSRKKFEQSENARWRAYYTRDSLANLLDESRAQCADERHRTAQEEHTQLPVYACQ